MIGIEGPLSDRRGGTPLAEDPRTAEPYSLSRHTRFFKLRGA